MKKPSACPRRIGVLLTIVLVSSASAQVPVWGRPVSQLSWADTLMTDFMEQFNITGGLLAIMKDGCIVYQRGFGWNDAGGNIPMGENSLVRIASCTKPFTAAAIRRLAADGAFGPEGVERFAFNLGQTGGGILNITPWPSLGDSRIRNIRIRHLYEHKGGWDRDLVGDWTYNECTIAGDMGIDSPPGRTNTLRWILGQALQFSPGAQQQYSNIGYLALGLIVEQVTGQSHITYLRQNILTQNMWVPSSDFRVGNTFQGDQPVREAWYDGSWGDNCVYSNVCGLGCSEILSNSAYGAWDHPARVGQGAIVLSPATMLEFLERYQVQVFSANIGLPLNGAHVNGAHNGALDGCNTYALQRSDGVNVFIFFNKDADGDGSPDDPSHFASTMADMLDPYLDAQANWPTLCLDGFWAEPVTGLPMPYGSYDREFHNITDAVATLGGGSKLNCRPGNYNWSGTISTKLLLRAPIGNARLGQP